MRSTLWNNSKLIPVLEFSYFSECHNVFFWKSGQAHTLYSRLNVYSKNHSIAFIDDFSLSVAIEQ